MCTLPIAIAPARDILFYLSAQVEQITSGARACARARKFHESEDKRSTHAHVNAPAIKPCLAQTPCRFVALVLSAPPVRLATRKYSQKRRADLFPRPLNSRSFFPGDLLAQYLPILAQPAGRLSSSTSSSSW